MKKEIIEGLSDIVGNVAKGSGGGSSTKAPGPAKDLALPNTKIGSLSGEPYSRATNQNSGGTVGSILQTITGALSGGKSRKGQAGGRQGGGGQGGGGGRGRGGGGQGGGCRR